MTSDGKILAETATPFAHEKGDDSDQWWNSRRTQNGRLLHAPPIDAGSQERSRTWVKLSGRVHVQELELRPVGERGAVIYLLDTKSLGGTDHRTRCFQSDLQE